MSENVVYPLYPMVLLILIPIKWLYFIGNIPNIFRQTHIVVMSITIFSFFFPWNPHFVAIFPMAFMAHFVAFPAPRLLRWLLRGWWCRGRQRKLLPHRWGRLLDQRGLDMEKSWEKAMGKPLEKLSFSTGWGPQDSVQLPYFTGFMVDITIVNRGYNGL